jgi:hypothetical protein
MDGRQVFFDLLCVNDLNLCDARFAEPRGRLESLLEDTEPPLHLTRATRDRTAADWFRRFEVAGLEGVVAKAEAGTYEPNKRVMLKGKHERVGDCVVATFAGQLLDNCAKHSDFQARAAEKSAGLSSYHNVSYATLTHCSELTASATFQTVITGVGGSSPSSGAFIRLAVSSIYRTGISERECPFCFRLE